MNTHITLEEARTAAKADPRVHCIVEIEHVTKGRCFIKLVAPMRNFEIVLRGNPMPEIKRLIAEHPVLTESESVAVVKQALRDHTNCERCGRKVDGNTAYSQQEWFQRMRVVAYYCEPCRRLLASIGQGEHSDLDERAGARPGYEPYTKED